MADPSLANLPDPPNQLRAIQSYMRIAKDIDRVDPVVGYWIRLFSTDIALKIDKDSQESKLFLVSLLNWLEKFKNSRKDDETVINQTVGQAHYENFVMALFNKADTLDRNGTADKNTVRMFFMASVLFEAMAVFGPLTEEISQRAKYAKFKAAYIQKCLKTGQTPKPGPIEGADLEGTGDENSANPSVVDASGQPPAPSSVTPTLPQKPMPGNDSGSRAASTSGGGLYIPEVPKDPFDSSGSASAIVPPKPTDPFILTPSVHPAISKPTLPDSNPASTMSTSDLNRSTIADAKFLATNGKPLKPEDILKGQKYCKFANSALQYDDIPTAVANLQKALQLLTTGQNPE